MDSNTSEFHGGFDYIHRLNMLFYCANGASSSVDAFQWHQTLLAIYRELSPWMNTEEKATMKSFALKLQTKVMTMQSVSAKTGNFSIPPILYWELSEFEIKLREIHDKAGLLTKRAEDASRALR